MNTFFKISHWTIYDKAHAKHSSYHIPIYFLWLDSPNLNYYKRNKNPKESKLRDVCEVSAERRGVVLQAGRHHKNSAATSNNIYFTRLSRSDVRKQEEFKKRLCPVPSRYPQANCACQTETDTNRERERERQRDRMEWRRQKVQNSKPPQILKSWKPASVKFGSIWCIILCNSFLLLTSSAH